MSLEKSKTDAVERDALFSAQTAKARQGKIEKLARGNAAVRELLEERNALTVAHGALKKQHVDAQARIADLEAQVADLTARLASDSESPPRRRG